MAPSETLARTDETAIRGQIRRDELQRITSPIEGQVSSLFVEAGDTIWVTDAANGLLATGDPEYREALGASGTIKAAASIAFENGWCTEEKTITRQALQQLLNALLEAGHVDNLKLKGLSEERKPVIPGGIAVLRAVFSVL